MEAGFQKTAKWQAQDRISVLVDLQTDQATELSYTYRGPRLVPSSLATVGPDFMSSIVITLVTTVIVIRDTLSNN